MNKSPKVELDETTLQIARRMLSTPPKPHDEMKLGKPTNPTHAKRKRKGKKAKVSR
jgi:hypothetical protein